MNKRLAVLGVFITLVVTGTAVAANNATANANATIVSPIAIVNNTPLEFGNIVAGIASGTVQVPAVTGTPVRVFGGGATGASGIAITAASFTVTGNSGAGWNLSTAPASVAGGLTSGALAPMPCTLTYSATTGTLTGGTATFYVGGTLSVAASQAAGSYTATFNVVAAYN
jgi:hypothetical protein